MWYTTLISRFIFPISEWTDELILKVPCMCLRDPNSVPYNPNTELSIDPSKKKSLLVNTSLKLFIMENGSLKLICGRVSGFHDLKWVERILGNVTDWMYTSKTMFTMLVHWNAYRNWWIWLLFPSSFSVKKYFLYMYSLRDLPFRVKRN